MGELSLEHVTMLVTQEQQQAVRTLFQDHSWPCLMQVLSAEIVDFLRKNGYDIFATPKHDIQGTQVSITDMHKHSAVEEAPGGMDCCSRKLKCSSGMTSVAGRNSTIQTSNCITCKTDAVGVGQSGADVYENIKNCDKESNRSDDDNIKMVHDGLAVDLCMDIKPELDTIQPDIRYCNKTFGEPNSSVMSESLNYLCFKSEVIIESNSYSMGSSSLTDSQHKMTTRSRGGNSLYMSDILGHMPQLPEKQKQLVNMDYEAGGEPFEIITNGKSSLVFLQGPNSVNEIKKSRRKYKTNPSKEFRCSKCQKVVKTKKELTEHEKFEHHETQERVKDKVEDHKEEAGDFHCLACGRVYKTKRKLQMHTYAQHKNLKPAYQCGVCDATFKAMKDLHAHKKETGHNDSVSMLGSYQCDDCGRLIKDYQNFKRHKKYSCPFIDEQILEKMKLSHPCDVCDMKFKSLRHLTRHKTSVHTVAPVVCDTCGTVCKNEFRLTKHKARHDEKNRKHECQECGKKFFVKFLLAQHMRIHTREKPFQCAICDYSCAIAVNLRKHILKVHKIRASGEDVKKSKCELLALGTSQSSQAVNSKNKKTVLRKTKSKLHNRDAVSASVPAVVVVDSHDSDALVRNSCLVQPSPRHEYDFCSEASKIGQAVKLEFTEMEINS